MAGGGGGGGQAEACLQGGVGFLNTWTLRVLFQGSHGAANREHCVPWPAIDTGCC